jgi:hypothetical protein
MASLSLVRGLRMAPDGAKGLAFSAFDFGRIGAATTLQIKVLADGFIE